MNVIFREARRDDVRAVITLLQDDVLGAGREVEDAELYLAAFDAMLCDGNNILIVGELDCRIIATYQLTLIAGLSLKATRRAQIESVRVSSDLRGQGIGALLMADAEARAKSGNAGLMQITADKRRARTHEFYQRCGFVLSHEGFKKPL